MRLQTLQGIVAMWSAVNAPDATIYTCMAHIKEEVKELEESLDEEDRLYPGEEMADIIILLAHLSQLYGFDLGQAVSEKMAIVVKRKYAKGEDGVYRHVEEQS